MPEIVSRVIDETHAFKPNTRFNIPRCLSERNTREDIESLTWDVEYSTAGKLARQMEN
jgi:hypothetical protein